MHELSLAQGLLDQLEGLARQHGGRIVRVEVVIGRQAGVVVDSFVFGFDAIKKTCEQTRAATLTVTTGEGHDLLLNRVELECDGPGEQNPAKERSDV
ncbi:MAG TPA: hydrogenase maturation nickel metallochaperone HypA [Desulfobulbus sp.]|nr:hydrogenase maturation nickel metallochaperone HypA [Desulfobulbus sp.]